MVPTAIQPPAPTSKDKAPSTSNPLSNPSTSKKTKPLVRRDYNVENDPEWQEEPAGNQESDEEDEETEESDE